MGIFVWVADLLRDLGHAGRAIRRSPVFFGGTAFVLALGIGANCTIFSLVHSVLLRPLPYTRPEEVVVVQSLRRNVYGGWGMGRPGIHTVNLGKIDQWRDPAAGIFSDLAVLKMWDYHSDARFDLVLPDRAERLRGGMVTPNFFSVLGVRAEVGRVFSPTDELGGRDDVVVLSHGLWQRLFGGDTGIIGRSVTLTSGLSANRFPRSYTVIGVLPQIFQFTYPVATEFWVIYPWSAVESAVPSALVFSGAVARLKAGISPAAAQRRVAQLEAHESGRRGGPGTSFTRVQGIAEWVAGETRPSLLLISAVSLLLLVVACATVANALLVRVSERKRELAVRAALGAGRGRLVRQLLTEGLAVSLVGTAGGVLLAAMLVPVFRSLVPAALPRAGGMAIDLPLLALPAAAGVLISQLVLLAPAIQGSGLNLQDAMKASSATATATASRWRFAFVAAQTTIATTLLVSAALLLTSFWRLARVDVGFDGKKVLTAEMRLLESKRYSRKETARFQQALVERIRTMPGVDTVGVTTAVPFRGDSSWVVFGTAGEPRVWANGRVVDPGYFSVMRIPLLRGRLLTERDTVASEPVGVVSESLARQAFPGEDPIGKPLRASLSTVTVVGIVKDGRYRGLEQAPFPAVYLASAQDATNQMSRICVVVRTSVDQRTAADMLRRAIHDIDPTVPVMGVTTIDEIISESVAGRRFYTTTTTAFAVLALLLTATGLVLIIARSVAERRRELAIRSALGAQTGDLVGLVTRQGLVPVILGVALGLWGAWVGSKLLQQFLFEVTPHEPAVYLSAGGLAILVAVLACLIPARRITGLDPATVLQSE